MKTLVVKIIARLHAKDRTDASYKPNELKVLELIEATGTRHANIISFSGYALNVPTPGRDSLFLGYCNGGDVYDLSEQHVRRRAAVSEDVVWQILSGVFDGLAFLHEGYQTPYFRTTITPNAKIWNPILHGDLKPENILIHYPANPTDKLGVKIGDFGCAVQYDRTAGDLEYDADYFGGTAEYAAPEAPLFTHKADVWGVAASLHLLCTGDVPVDQSPASMAGVAGWRDMGQEELLRKLPRRAHDVSLAPEGRRPLDDGEALGCKVWQGTYSVGLQCVMSCGLAVDMDVRGGAADMVSLIKQVRDAM
jgi:serine/threonine protein kinase